MNPGRVVVIAALVVLWSLSAPAAPSHLQVASDNRVVVPGQAFIVSWYFGREEGYKVVDPGSVDVDGADVMSSEGRNAVRSSDWTIVASNILIARRDGVLEIPSRVALLERVKDGTALTLESESLTITVLPLPPDAPHLVATDLQMKCESPRTGGGLRRHVTVTGYGDLRKAEPPVQTGSPSIRYTAKRGIEPYFKNQPTTFGLKMVAEWDFAADWDQGEPAVLPRLELRYFDPADGFVKTARCEGDIVLPSNPRLPEPEEKTNDEKQPEVKPIQPGYWSLPAFFAVTSVALLTLVRERSSAPAPRRVSSVRNDLRRLIDEAGIPESWYRDDQSDVGRAYRELTEHLGSADASAPVDATLAAKWGRFVAALRRRWS